VTIIRVFTSSVSLFANSQKEIKVVDLERRQNRDQLLSCNPYLVGLDFASALREKHGVGHCVASVWSPPKNSPVKNKRCVAVKPVWCSKRLPSPGNHIRARNAMRQVGALLQR